MTPRALRPLAIALLAMLARPVLGGPTLACPGGPDPVRFRPETSLPACSADPEPVAVAAATDATNGREWVAVALLTPAREVAVMLSGDGACTFASSGGGFGPVIVSGAGESVAERPAVALTADAGGVRLAVAWRTGRRVIARGTRATDGSFGAATPLDDLATGPPRLAAAGAAAPVFAATWLRDGGGGVVPRVTLTSSPDDGSTWSSAQDLAPPATAENVEVACVPMSELGGPACSVLASTAGGRAYLAHQPGGFATLTRVDDGSSSSLALATMAGSVADGAGWWLVPAWASRETAPAGSVVVDADGRLADATGEVAACDGSSGRPNPTFGAAAAVRPGAAVTGGEPGAQAWVVLEQGGELRAARRTLSTATPRLQGGCGPAQLTGLSPVRSGGAARAPVAASLGADVVTAFVDTRTGAPQAWVKRSDGRAPVANLTAAAPAGCGAPPRVVLAWDPLPCDAVLVTVEVGTAPGGTDFTRALAPAAGTTVEGLEPGVTYYFRLRVRDAADNEGVSNEMSAATPSCSAALVQAAFASVADACAAGGAGGDGDVDPGETVRVTVRVTNQGTAPAPAARVRLQSRSGFVTVRSPTQDVGDLAPGASADAVFDADVSATAGCGAPLEVLARTDAGGAAWADLLALPVATPCTPCRLAGCSVTADASRTAPATICAGATVTLDATASASSSCAGTLVYEWYAGTALLGTGATLSQQPAASVSYRLVARCTTDFDCSAETSTFVTVNPLPSLSLSESPPPPHCEGDVVTLTASASDPAATFAWGDGPVTAARDVTAGGTYTVTATDSNGCRRSRTLRVDFGPVPVADAGPDVAGCGAQAIGTPGFPLLDYAWEPPDGLADPTAAQTVAAPAVPTTYTLTVTDPLTGCFAVDRVDVASTPGPGPYRAFVVTKSAAGLAFSWEVIPSASEVRVYADADPARAAGANASSPSARRLCADTTSCTAPMPPESLLFLQAVGACPGGATEGPN